MTRLHPGKVESNHIACPTRDKKDKKQHKNSRELGLISGRDGTDYRDAVQRLTAWCSENNINLNPSKTKELVIDFTEEQYTPRPLYINGDCVERVPAFRFLGTHIAEGLSWTSDTSAVVKRAQHRLHFLRILRKTNLQVKLLASFYRCSVESVCRQHHPEDHRLLIALSGGPVQLSPPQESSQHTERPIPPWTSSV